MGAHPRCIRLPETTYELLLREAGRQGIQPASLIDELLRADLSEKPGDLESVLTELADLRAGLPRIDGVALTRKARDQLQRRGA
jgi:hypothetical protein